MRLTMMDASEWLDHYRTFWTQSFDRLDEYLEEMKTKEKKHARISRRRKNV